MGEYTELVAALREGNHSTCTVRYNARVHQTQGVYVHRNEDGTVEALRGCDLCEERFAAADAIETQAEMCRLFGEEVEIADSAAVKARAEVERLRGALAALVDEVDGVSGYVPGNELVDALAAARAALGIGETKETPQ